MLHSEARKLLAEAYEKYGNAEKIGKMYGVSESTVYRIVRRYRKDGNTDVLTSQRGRKRKLTPMDEKNIGKLIEEQNDITIREIKEKLQLDVGEETIRRTVVSLGFRYKKKSMHATERDRLRCKRKESRMVRDHAEKG